MREARRKLSLSAGEMSAALGYSQKNKHHARQHVYDIEAGRKPIGPATVRLVEMFIRYGVPADFI